MTPKEKAHDIIDYIAGTHLKQYGKVNMMSVLEEASSNALLIIKNRIADELDTTYWKEVRREILSGR